MDSGKQRRILGGFRAIYLTTFALALLSMATMSQLVSHKRIAGSPEERKAQEPALLNDMEIEAGLTTLPAFEG